MVKVTTVKIKCTVFNIFSRDSMPSESIHFCIRIDRPSDKISLLSDSVLKETYTFLNLNVFEFCVMWSTLKKMQFIVFMFLFTALCKPSFQSLALVTTMKEGHSWLPYCGQKQKKLIN